MLKLEAQGSISTIPAYAPVYSLRHCCSDAIDVAVRSCFDPHPGAQGAPPRTCL